MMRKRLDKTTKTVLGGSVFVVVALLCCLIGLKGQVDKKWREGIYLHDFDINVCCYEGKALLKLNTLLVGEDYLNLAKESSLKFVMTGEDVSVTADCQMAYFCEEGKGYQVAFDIYPEIAPGVYSFDEMQLWYGSTCLTVAKGTAQLNVIGHEEIEMQENYDFALVNCWMNTSGCEFIYQLVNNSNEDIEILSFDGRLKRFKEKEKITIVNNVEIEETNIDFIKEKSFEMPLILKEGKKAYIRYVVPLQETEIFSNLLVYPLLVYQSASRKEPLKMLLNGYCSAPAFSVTQEQITSYIAERDNQ